ncbi:MAG: OmpA family protein [Fibrobacterota bacterium]|nr:OmpA family protein [Fibrobacterota bacterium]
MAKFDLTMRELEKGRQFAIGEAHVVHVTKGRGHLLEMEDVNFHFDSAVLLPDPKCGDDAETSEQDRITGLSVLAACYKHAKDHTRELLFIAGHADTKGGDDYNITLSQQRADNVFFALIGDRENWAQLSHKHNQVEDRQAILKWIDKRFGWGTDPGAVDNKDGAKTQAAVKAFQKRYNAEFSKSIAVDGVTGLDTWRGFFDVYMMALAGILETDEDGLIKLRGNLTFLDGGKKTIGCGENHPIEAAGNDNFRSATNRRVELLFFDPKDKLPKLDCHPAAGKCKKDLCEIYGKGLFDFKHIACGGETPGFSGAFGEGEPITPHPSEAPPQETGDEVPQRPRGIDADAADLSGDT